MSQYAPDLFEIKRNKNADPQPDHDLGLWALLVICIIAAFFVVFTFTSCNAYNRIEKREPRTSSDSAKLLKRATPLLRTPAPVVKQGKPIIRIVKVPKDILVPDAAGLKRATDSVIAQYERDGIAIAKDCEQSVKQALDKGVKQGYQLAVKDFGELTFEDKAPDTVFLPNDSLAAVTIATRIDWNKAEQEVIKQTAQKDTYRGLFWVLLALLIISGALNVKQLLSTKTLIKKYSEL